MLLRPRYKPMANLPTVNSAAVTTAPIQTSLQAILTSGNSLKIIANSSVITTNDTAMFAACASHWTASGSRSATTPTEAIAAVNSRETSSRNATPMTIANERNRSLMKPTTPRPLLGFTSQMVFNASCN